MVPLVLTRGYIYIYIYIYIYLRVQVYQFCQGAHSIFAGVFIQKMPTDLWCYQQARPPLAERFHELGVFCLCPCGCLFCVCSHYYICIYVCMCIHIYIYMYICAYPCRQRSVVFIITEYRGYIYTSMLYTFVYLSTQIHVLV